MLFYIFDADGNPKEESDVGLFIEYYSKVYFTRVPYEIEKTAMEIVGKDEYKKNRKIDRALWTYGHIVSCNGVCK